MTNYACIRYKTFRNILGIQNQYLVENTTPKDITIPIGCFKVSYHSVSINKNWLTCAFHSNYIKIHNKSSMKSEWRTTAKQIIFVVLATRNWNNEGAKKKEKKKTSSVAYCCCCCFFFCVFLKIFNGNWFFSRFSFLLLKICIIIIIGCQTMTKEAQ